MVDPRHFSAPASMRDPGTRCRIQPATPPRTGWAHHCGFHTGLKLVLPNGEPFREPRIRRTRVHQNRLPGVDWQVLDELVAGDRLRSSPTLLMSGDGCRN